MPPELTALVQLVGAPAVIVLVLVFRDWVNGKSSAKQDDAMTDLAVTSNAERKERQEVIDKLQTSNNHLQAEVFAIQLKQAEDTGRREEIKEAMQRERDEWKTERIANDEKFRKMESRIFELEKHRDQSTLRITELENQITELERKLATANVEIDLITAQKRELETLLEMHRNRAESLSAQITRMQTETATDKTVPIPELQTWDEETEVTANIPPRQLEDDDGNPTPNAA